ncbi:MAG: FecR domain-containing protein [Candidatus Marinimicrobia bacterium]|nr:FecR domain-containing protein [Candidatus Neomarinimicrobiota bacterium]
MNKKHITLLIITCVLVFAQTVFASPIARIVKANGDVFLKRLGEQTYSETATPGIGINNGDGIKVGSESFAVVIFLDDRSVVKVKEKTQFQFMDTQNTRNLNIEVGTILNDVKKSQQKRTYRVETPVSVASVKGTQFTAVVDPSGIDQFYGTEGLVEVFNLISGQTAMLSAGQKVISNAMGNLMMVPANPNEYPEDPDSEETEETESEEATEEEETEEETPEETESTEEAIDETPGEGEDQAEETPTEEPGPPQENELPPVEEVEEPQPQAPKPFGMGLGIGSVTIDGALYNQLAFRPELSFGKLGLGLDLVFYIDNEGNFWNDPWNFKEEPGLVLDKILFIQWGEKTDSFWFKWGSLENVTLGYGGLVSGYSNMMEFPSIRRVGINTGFSVGPIMGEVFMANIKDFVRGGTLLGFRSTYKVSKAFPLTIGVNLVADMNQFSGMKDKDEDSYPDIFDDFPDDKTIWNDTDGDGTPDPHDGLAENEWDIDADGDNNLDEHAGGTDIPELKGTPFSIEDNKGVATGLAIDIGYPVFSNKMVSLSVFSEMNMLSFPEVESIGRLERKGTGITVPGIRATILKMFHLSLEYRLKQDYYIPQFFDQGYDLNRVVAVYNTESEDAQIYTKDMLIFEDPSAAVNTSGWFGSASMNVLNLVNFAASYANMVAEEVTYRSFFAQINLNTDNIPKLSVASAYYQRNNDENPFDFENPSENTVLGYRVGYEIGDGVSLIWDYRQYYRDVGNGLEPVKQTSIETAFTF